MMIKVVKGNPTPEELAAALAVVRARAAAGPGARAPPPRPLRFALGAMEWGRAAVRPCGWGRPSLR
ncbi:acyl-CoA carboxylase epsilon subunit, partial [Streptomyces sp. NPDC059578]|uniref:acyl-CoA carboxylase epsilon subunit n=1 Tax=Streptomyces sp. NPDC059578 TaxID=3346874 RepID=UPI0036CAE7B2